MKDYQTAEKRLSNLDYEWVRDGFKELMLCVVLVTVFLVLITQPGGII